MEPNDNDPRAPRNGLRVVTLYFTEETYADLEVRGDILSFDCAVGRAERVVIDDDVVRDRIGDLPPIVGRGHIEVGPRDPGGPVTVTAAKGSVGMIPTGQP